MIRNALVPCILALAANCAFAQNDSPIGIWKTVDDETKKVNSEVKIEERGGQLYGTVIKIANPAEQEKICDKCEDDRKDKKVIGMEIIRGLKKNGEVWDGGTILQPTTGRVFKSSIKLVDGGQKLEVKGSFLFISKTQTWIRGE